MKVFYLGEYSEFKCIAGECPATCCQGWSIKVDREAYERYTNLEDRQLSRQIISAIRHCEKGFSFINRADGRCAMLDDDGLCFIQRNTDEKMLCNTCRKYPRITVALGEDVYISMAASCPVVAKYLCNDRVSWSCLYDGKANSCNVCRMGIPIDLKAEMEATEKLLAKFYLPENLAGVCAGDIMKIYDVFSGIAESIVTVIACHDEYVYMNGSFDWYENVDNLFEFSSGLCEFSKGFGPEFEKFKENYVNYRLVSRYLEFMDESPGERCVQVGGEIISVLCAAASMYMTEKNMSVEKLEQILAWLYRIVVHGESSRRKLHNEFLNVLDY